MIDEFAAQEVRARDIRHEDEVQSSAHCEPTGASIVTLVKLTDAGNLENLAPVAESSHHVFVQRDICDRPLVSSLLADDQIDALVHFAAELVAPRFARAASEGSTDRKPSRILVRACDLSIPR